ELPELGHEPRVRVGAQRVRGTRLLLTEPVEIRFAEAALQEGARVHPGGCMTLVEDLVTARGVVLSAEEPVVTDLVQRGARGVGRDVAADGDLRPLSAVHRDRGVPSDPAAVLPLELLIAREGGFVLRGDRVDVV